MSNNPYNTQEFKQLQKEWDERLRLSGFIDIEQTVGDQRVLSQRSSNSYQQDTEWVINNKLEYFQAITYYVNLEDTVFDSEVDRMIMERRADGVSIRSICEALSAVALLTHKSGYEGQRYRVRFIIHKYEHRWNIKHHSSRNMAATKHKRSK